MNIPPFMDYKPLLTSFRSDYPDNTFYAIFGIYDKNGLIKGNGTFQDGFFWLRSLFKPVQALLINKNIRDYFNFTEKELAIMQSSHAGEEYHIELIKSILNKIKLREEHLLCPEIAPLNTSKFKGKSRLHNNCSGKHCMILSYCIYHNLDITDYINVNHPAQIKIRENLIKLSETKDLILSTDGCLMPIYGMKLNNIAKMFLNLYKENSFLTEAYKNNPRIIGGRDDFSLRTDTKIMLLDKNLISKVGAGGFIYVYNILTEQILILKTAQNNNPEREILTLEILYRLNWLKERFYKNEITLENNKKIGEYRFNF